MPRTPPGTGSPERGIQQATAWAFPRELGADWLYKPDAKSATQTTTTRNMTVPHGTPRGESTVHDKTML
jgi:hypothetical protein